MPGRSRGGTTLTCLDDGRRGLVLGFGDACFQLRYLELMLDKNAS